MALVNPQQVAATGGAVTYATPTTSETFVPDDRAAYHVKIGATSTTVTLVVPGSAYGQARPDVVLSGLTNTDRFIGPLVPDLADPTTGLVNITLSQTTNVTAALVRV